MNLDLLYKLSNIIVPVFLLIGLGVFLNRKKIITENMNSGIQRLIYLVTLPLLLFTYIIKNSLNEILNFPYMFLVAVLLLLMFGISVKIASSGFAKKDKDAILHGLNSFYVSSTYIGLPISYFAFGDEGIVPAVLFSVILALIVSIPIFSCRLIDAIESGVESRTEILKELASSFFKNPFLMTPFIAIVWLWVGFEMPAILNKSFNMVGSITIPLALISIGAALSKMYNDGLLKKLPKIAKEVLFISASKSIFMPILAWIIISQFNFEHVWEAVFVLQAATPTGIICYVICTDEKAFKVESALVVFLTTVISFASLFVILGFYV